MRFDLIPWPINCAVIVGTPLLATAAEYMKLINPLLQGLAYIVAILWGVFQMWLAWRRHDR